MMFFLIGFMGSGKSTLGKRFANLLAVSFYDLDDFIVDKYHLSISEFFKEFGEEYFRELEHKALKELIQLNQSMVISTGGGTPCFFNNMELMKQNGIVIYLKLPALDIVKRIFTSHKKRPLIEMFNNQEELLKWVEKTLSYRETFYSKAHLTIDANNLKPKSLLSYLKQLNLY